MSVDPYLLRRAETYINKNWVPFFDFFRQMVFGFVITGQNRGFYVSAKMDNNQIKSGSCNCKDGNKGLVCEHALALYLLANDWPFDPAFLPGEFEQFAINTFFASAHPKILKCKLTDNSNPSTALDVLDLDLRFISFLFNQEDAMAKRDQKAFLQAVEKERTDGEKIMLARGVPSKRCLYENSDLYKIAKLAFFLFKRSALKIQIFEQENHYVTLQLAGEKSPFFRWRMKMSEFLSHANHNMAFWGDYLEVNHQPIAVQIQYQMSFESQGNLKVRPGIALDESVDGFIPLSFLEKVDTMFFQAEMGYFYTQTGLSEFELIHSSKLETVVEKSRVPSYLKKYQNDFKQLNRQFMDQSLIGKILITRVSRVKLNLTHFADFQFRCSLQFLIETAWVPFNMVPNLCQVGSERYWNIQNRFFDSQSLDGMILKELIPLLRDDILLLPCQLVFQLLLFFHDRIDVECQGLSADELERMKAMQIKEKPKLDRTNLTLRPYQETGLDWLWFLYSFGLGGLLCDQMGLGKTHQGMALMASIKNSRSTLTALIVCPRSVLFHWQEKLSSFCPDLSVHLFHGSTRDPHEALKSDVILTTYGTLRTLSGPFSSHVFDLILLDEIQNVKNKKTLTYQGLQNLLATSRVGLTGTPLENSLTDLKSLMDTVLPGYLGSDTWFKQGFELPISRYHSKPAKKLLKDLTHPFILRRSKAEVLPDLPQKIEDVCTFQLLSWERQVYKEIMDDGKTGMYVEGKPSFLHVFQLINNLKRFCNHPALFFNHADYVDYPSQKWEFFTSLLEELIESGEKVVVFTQYLGMIEFFKKYLDRRGTSFACITGSVTNRQAEQNRFQQDPHCRVFLGTLGAAGVGIDLTAASAVIHYDRWWNPAREEQATDRIHRIGQNKTVQVFKLMAKDTIEERIDFLIESKKKLLEDIVEFDADQAIKRLSVNELLEILG